MAYGHMSRDQKVEFLKTEDPNTKYIESFFLSQPQTDKAKFIGILNATKSNMDTYQSEINNVYTGDAFKIEEKIGAANKHFVTALYTQSLNHDLDYGDGLMDNNIFELIMHPL
jgi:hypothetical protein